MEKASAQDLVEIEVISFPTFFFQIYWPRIVYFLLGVVVPIVCFYTALFDRSPLSGDGWAYIFNPDLIYWYVPALVLSILGMAFILIKPKFVNKYWTRLGIYFGCLLGLLYSAFMGIVFCSDSFEFLLYLFLSIGAFYVIGFIWHAMWKKFDHPIWELIIGFILFASLMTWNYVNVYSLDRLIEMWYFLTLFIGCFCTTVVFIDMAVRIFRHNTDQETKPKTKLTMNILWLLTYIIPTTIYIFKIFESYQISIF